MPTETAPFSPAWKRVRDNSRPGNAVDSKGRGNGQSRRQPVVNRWTPYRTVQNVAHPRLPCSWTSTYQKGHSARSPESDSVAGYPRGTQCSISKNANGHALGGIVGSTAYSFLAFARHVSTAALSVRCALPRRPT